MAIDPSLLVIKPVNELEKVLGLQPGSILFYDDSLELKIIDIATFNNLSQTAKPISISDATPTQPGLFKPTTSGMYPNAGGLVAQEGYSTLFFFDGTTWTKSEEKMPESDYTYESGVNKMDLSYAQLDKAIASNGNVANLVGAISIIMLPLKSNTTYTLSGFVSGSSKYMAMKNVSAVTVGGVITLNPATPKTFTTPNEETFLNVYGKNPTDPITWDNILMLNEGDTALPYEPFELDIKTINGHELIADVLTNDNRVPSPVNSYNGVNLGYFDDNALRVEDLSVSTSTNIAKPEYIVNDQYVNNAGSISGGAGWRYIKIPVDTYQTGQQITFGRFTINGGGYASFRNFTDNTLTEYLGAISGATRTVVKPAGATHLCIDIKRPADDGTNYAQLTVNLGPELLPYESPLGKITEIKGYDIGGSGGGQAYDQSLNTTDIVEFAGIVASQIETSVLIANLPIGNTGLTPGKWYLEADGNGDFNTKVKG